jgi:hypothetical protein
MILYQDNHKKILNSWDISYKIGGIYLTLCIGICGARYLWRKGLAWMLLFQRIQLLMHPIDAARIAGPVDSSESLLTTAVADSPSRCKCSGFGVLLKVQRIQQVDASAADPASRCSDNGLEGATHSEEQRAVPSKRVISSLAYNFVTKQ